MIIEYLRSAWMSLTGNKLRTALSMIGIVIGVASVVAITALGQSASASIKANIAKAGLETVIVMPGRGAGSSVERVFKDTLLDRLDSIDGVISVAAVNQARFNMKSSEASAQETITSAVPEFASIFSITARQGRFLTREDMDTRASVVVLGTELASTLFPEGDAVGRSIKLLGESPRQLRVVGVLESRTDTFGFSFDSGAFVPRTSYLSRLSRPKRVDRFVFRADASKDVIKVSERIGLFFKEELGSEEAYRVMSPSTIADTMSGVTDTFSGFLAGIAAISLVVGGIGIMNIMLVSVTERTKEIGIRKALGATPAAIRSQFLVEAVAITLAGGVIGLALGAGITLVVTKIFAWTFTFPPGAAALAIAFSAATGIFFGLYPAARAAKLDPTTALAYE